MTGSMGSWKWMLALVAAVAAGGLAAERAPAQAMARGVVYHDRDGDRRRDEGEEGLPGIRVSNGREIVKTDSGGRWQLAVDDDDILFVTKPRGWAAPLNKDNLPQFYYIHKPEGSPASRYAGVAPTGPLPPSVDFALRPQREPEKFKALFFGDPQPRNNEEVEYISHDVVEALIGSDASFGVTLGDIAFDNLDTFEPLNGAIALIGIPWYNVLGNHDVNMDARTDRHSDETFERIYGPSYYSFDHGPVHFIVLDDIEWLGQGDGGRRYRGGLGREQLEWVKRDVALTPERQLIVLMMHIPLVDVEDRQELYRVIEDRPYTMSVSAHTHYQEHRFIGTEDGWRGKEPHHHVINVTISGSWWSGARDERGIPHTTMRDGAPNGYSIFSFDGSKYDIEYRAASRPAAYQMNIYAPEEIRRSESAETAVLANVFSGSIRSKVEMRVGDGEWLPMERVEVEDPAYLVLKQQEQGPNPPAGRALPNVMKSPHIWRAMLPGAVEAGVQQIRVRHTDMFGRKQMNDRVIRVLP